MTADLDTHIAGDPGAIEAVATWLRATLRDAALVHADTTLSQSSRAESAWEGDASDSFRDRLTTVARAGDDISEAGQTQGLSLDTLAADLRFSLAEMERARQLARGGGLIVDGTIVRNPGDGPPRPGAPGKDATEAVVAEYNSGVAAFEAHQLLIACWKEVISIADEASASWTRAVEAAAERWQSNAGNLATLSHGFLAGAAGGGSVAAQQYAFNSKEFLHNANANSLRNHVDALTNPDGSTRGPNTRINELLNEIDSEEAASTAARDAAADPPLKPSSAVSDVLRRLGYVATGYGIYDDINNGESVGQAVTSNVGGLLGGMGAGAAMGAVAGSIAPGAGTVVGAVVGGIAGGVGSIAAAGAIDSIWEEGFSGQVFAAGMREVGTTASDLGGLAADGWKALFD